MKSKRDPRDVVYDFDGAKYVGTYDSNGNFHPPCRPSKSLGNCRLKKQPSNTEPTKDQDIINLLRSENAYLRGKIEAYEKFLKDKGFTKEEENEKVSD